MRLQVATSFLAAGLLACAADSAPVPPAQLLGNPVLDARAALAGGDSTFLGLLDPELQLPGVDSASAPIGRERSVRVFSRASLGLAPRQWEAQRDSLRVYAAAYNQLILEARRESVEGAS